jgi:hypothetical protein
MVKADPTFIPTKDARTRCWNVCGIARGYSRWLNISVIVTAG